MQTTNDLSPTKIILFRDKTIRRQLYHDEWWFVVEDVIAAVTETVNPNDYFKKLRKRDSELEKIWIHGGKLGGDKLSPPVELTFMTPAGKRNIKCWNTEGIFRLIQSIPSKKAEPFKRWLAKVGYERIQEIENPELAQKRMKMTYRLKGYSEAWIERRVRGIAIRDELTDEWQKRGVKEEIEYSILTAEISKATFGITPSKYKKLKNLKRENLRDHMNDLELLFTQLGEAATTEIARTDDSQGFDENKDAAQRGGEVAGIARRNLEKQTKRKVVSEENFKEKREVERLG